MRLFIAAKIDNALIGNVFSELKFVMDNERNVKWESQNKVHITLKFLGDVEEKSLSSIISALKVIKSKPITLNVVGMGGFPNVNRPRVLWVGIDGDLAKLKVLQANVENAMYNIGFEKEKRPFKPHLTLGRVKRPIDNSTTDYFNSNAFKEFGKFIVNDFVLMQSELQPTGAKHTPLEVFPFG